MYKKTKNSQQTTIVFEEFKLPFGGKLNANNRWVKLSELIPWDKFEDEYSSKLSKTIGASALPFRIALGSLIIRERLNLTDRETVDQITENPYLQYFLGNKEFKLAPPFDASMLVHFRKRISSEMLSRINESVIASALKETTDNDSKKDDDNQTPPKSNCGKIMIDATCIPADIRFPTDLSLLNEAREKSEKIIDILWQNRTKSCNFKKKPRSYRQKARKDFLKIIRRQKDRTKSNRKGVGKQLNYLKRNLNNINTLVKTESLSSLSNFYYQSLLVINEVYRQQNEMFRTKTHRISNRIVNITQPHVRPIVRGKAGKKVEFGAKISASSFMGFTTVDRISWDAYNECEDLKNQAKIYKKRFGYYPASIHADKIYQNRKNRKWCKEKGIRLSGIALGRPKKITEENKDILKAKKKQLRKDEIDRIDIEGRFGHSKRRYGLARIMAKLSKTSETIISLVFLVMNLEKVLRELFLSIFSQHLTCCNYIIRVKLINRIHFVISKYATVIFNRAKLTVLT